MGELSALLAPPALGHRRGPRERRRPGDPRRGVLRRGHDDPGGRGRPPGAGRGTGGGRGAGPVPVDAGPRVSRQDECHDGARRAGARPRACGAYDFAGSSRSAVATLLQASGGREARARTTTWRVVSDLRTGLAGSAEERDSGDGAAAFVCAPDGAVAELIGRGAASDEFLDRWRVPGRGRLPRLGGALRRGALRATGPGGLRRRAEGRRIGRG